MYGKLVTFLERLSVFKDCIAEVTISISFAKNCSVICKHGKFENISAKKTKFKSPLFPCL